MDAHLSTLRLLTVLVTAALAPLVAGAVAPPAAGPGVWPLRPEPPVVDGFDPPATRWGPGHRGVDLAGRNGQRVFAALAGTVTFAGPLAGRGVVVVDHGTTRTTYEPVRASVAPGDTVAAGDPLGRLEAFGSHCVPAACLHWGLVEGARYLDPLSLVGQGPVRLLPLFGDQPLISAPAQGGGATAAGHGPVRPAGTTRLGVGPLFRQLSR